MVHRRVTLRRLDETGQDRSLTQGDLADTLAEVEAAGLLDSVAAVAKVDLAEVQEENFVLLQILLQPLRQHDLLHFTLHAPLRREEEGFHHLLSDGRTATGSTSPQPLG